LPASPATVLLTAIAMLAFAGNSILCRLALSNALIDAASFTMLRAASGACVLALILLARRQSPAPHRSDWLPATMLFAYMICFSLAYVSLSAGTGALILFGAVQITMISWAIRSGERLSPLSLLGLVLAIGGLIWLVSPGVTAPDPAGAILMSVAGVAWGIYSLLGRNRHDASASTARNFLLATPLAIVASLAMLAEAAWSWPGALLAIASGGITSGLGYVAWYAAIPKLSATHAASVQLTVPVIASLIGVLLLAESVTARLLLASIAVLGGVGIVIARRGARSR